jgi:hypothetical protein
MIKNILWQRSGGHWLFWISALYMIACVVNIEIINFANIVVIQMVWLGVLCLPLVIPRLAHFLNMRSLWDNGQEIKETPVPANIVDFPAPKAVPPMPKVEPLKKSKEYYRVGFDDANEMVTLTMLGDGGSSMTLSMNHGASEQLIRMIRSAFPEDSPTNPTEE